MPAEGKSPPDQANGTPEVSLASNGARALAAAITQIELALREARTPVEQLGSLTERMTNALRALRAARTQDDNAAPDYTNATVKDFSVERLQKDLYDSIQQLQFFDRMVQHVSHVQNYLSSVANQLASAAESQGSADIWDDLRAKLRTNLITDAQRELLDLVLPPPSGTPSVKDTAPEERASRGSVELF